MLKAASDRSAECRSGIPVCVVCVDEGPQSNDQPAIAQTLCRAVRLLLSGTLGPDDLPLALGLAADSVARLFRGYVGVSPDRLADLAERASVSPSGRDGAQPQEAASSPQLELKLPYEGPLDFVGVLALLGLRAAPGIEVVAKYGYHRSIALGATAGEVSVVADRWQQLRVVVELSDWSMLAHVAGGVRRIFNLDIDVKGASRWLQRDSVVGPLIRSRPGLRPPGSWNLFEAAVKAILCCGWDHRAAGWMEALGNASGAPFPEARHRDVRRLFPTPEAVGALPMSDLGLPFAKAMPIHALARAVGANGSIVDPAVPLARRLQLLGGVPGVGPLSAARYAWIAGHPDAYPDKTGASLPGTRLTASRKRTTLVEDRWRPFRSFAYAHLSALSGGSGPSDVTGGGGSDGRS